MTTTSKSPFFQAIDQDGLVTLASVPDSPHPVAILEEKTIDLLFAQCRHSKAEALKMGGNAISMLELCTSLEGVLKSYRKMRDEYYHRVEIELERDEAEQRLQDASNAIQKLQQP